MFLSGCSIKPPNKNHYHHFTPKQHHHHEEEEDEDEEAEEDEEPILVSAAPSMGNHHKFRFSDMIPSSWLSKLSRRNNNKKPDNSSSFSSSSASCSISSSSASAPPPNPPISDNRKSYHFVRDSSPVPPETPPRKSSRLRRSTRKTRPTNAATGGGILNSDEDLRRNLHPIITKRIERDRPIKPSGGVKLRRNSPRLMGLRRIHDGGVAVVKSSRDPRRDFLESMVEMIRENNLKESKELEELLACYLFLNADEYHHVIIGAFKQLWIQLFSSSVHRSDK